jgi:competence protein ComEC
MWVVAPCRDPSQAQAQAQGKKAVLDLHFLNVGHGDCTFVKFDSGRLMMVDVNNSTSLPRTDEEGLAAVKGLSLDSFRTERLVKAGAIRETWEDYYRSFLVDPYEFYASHFPAEAIFRYIQTHPDMDHMSGLHRFFFDEAVPIQNFWDTKNERSQDYSTFNHAKFDWDDWVAYNTMRSGHTHSDSWHTVLNLSRGEHNQFWEDDGISILSPSSDLIALANENQSWNDLSYVIKITYAGRSVILPGDAESAAWNDILASYDDEVLKCDVLKAAHHGRKSGFHAEAVTAMSPEMVVCSVGHKPDTDASQAYRDMGASVYSTRYHGTIRLRMWSDGEVWLEDRDGNRLHSLPELD